MFYTVKRKTRMNPLTYVGKDILDFAVYDAAANLTMGDRVQ